MPTGRLCPDPVQRAEVAARGRQEEGDEGNARIGTREVERRPRDPLTEPEILRPQHEAEVPLRAFLLEPTPADIPAIRQKGPVTETVARPAASLATTKARASASPQAPVSSGMCSRRRGSDICASRSGQRHLGQPREAEGGDDDGHAVCRSAMQECSINRDSALSFRRRKSASLS